MADLSTLSCVDCGSDMDTLVEDYDYEECGIPNTVIKDCLVNRCTECGRTEWTVDIEFADREIAKFLIDRGEKMTYEETRFLFQFIVDNMDGIPYYNQVGEA
jgi:uncharacterized Zn finger protein